MVNETLAKAVAKPFFIDSAGDKWFHLTDLEHKEELLWWQKLNLSYTTTGYGKRIPTVHMVKLPNEKRWRRVYCRIYSNSGTCYVQDRKGKRLAVIT